MAKSQSVSEALTMTSAASSTSQAIVVTLAGANEEPDATDDSGGAVTADESNAITTGNVLANGREQDVSDGVSVLAPRGQRSTR